MIVDINELQIDTPLSTYLNTKEWDDSPLGQLAKETDEAVYLQELDYRNQSAPYAWRVVYAVWSPEDTTMTRFRAYGLNGEHLPFANFGVHYDNMPSDRQHIRGRFDYRPPFGNQYLWLTENNFLTANTSGYKAQVLDPKYPSEVMAFGLGMHGQQHRSLIIGFRLFPLGPGYPH